MMTDLNDVLASRYEVEVARVAPTTGGPQDWWKGEAYLVTKTTRQLLLTVVRDSEQGVRNEVFEFLRDRPR